LGFLCAGLQRSIPETDRGIRFFWKPRAALDYLEGAPLIRRINRPTRPGLLFNIGEGAPKRSFHCRTRGQGGLFHPGGALQREGAESIEGPSWGGRLKGGFDGGPQHTQPFAPCLAQSQKHSGWKAEEGGDRFLNDIFLKTETFPGGPTAGAPPGARTGQAKIPRGGTDPHGPGFFFRTGVRRPERGPIPGCFSPTRPGYPPTRRNRFDPAPAPQQKQGRRERGSHVKNAATFRGNPVGTASGARACAGFKKSQPPKVPEPERMWFEGVRRPFPQEETRKNAAGTRGQIWARRGGFRGGRSPGGLPGGGDNQAGPRYRFD